ncbi:hypothetical protein [uncultured Aquimarina sp.]|uniref:hypothetical protein n=1 Tax=uncultured Aquimarina sp. TaxID=575652 RepID=UPI002617233C|nr:hypothetical protein [uncultured Aquimarina sp.]
MSKLNHIFLILFFSFSCQSQKDLTSVKYELKKDTIICSALEGEYSFNTIKITHKDIFIEKKINAYLLEQEYDQNTNSYISIYQKSIDSLKKSCNEAYDFSNFIFNEYEVLYNSNYFLSLKDSYYLDRASQENISFYNFNLRNGELYNVFDIIEESKKIEFLALINTKVQNAIDKEIKDSDTKEKIDLDRVETIKEYRKEFTEENLDSFFLKKDKETLKPLLSFHFSLEMPQVVKAFEPHFDLSFPVNEIILYLNPSFTKQFKLN